MPDLSSEFSDDTLLKQGAEARIYTGRFLGKPCVVKQRFSKKYRHPALDVSLTQQRTKSEVRAMARCRMVGILTPTLYLVDLEENKIYMEYFNTSSTLRDHIHKVQAAGNTEPLVPLVKNIGNILGKMHRHNIIHGDLTTSNMLLTDDQRIVLIDFGLGYVDNLAEDKGVDLYVLERAFLSTHPNTEALFTELLEGYKVGYGKGFEEVISKLDEVRLRGRKRTMLG